MKKNICVVITTMIVALSVGMFLDISEKNTYSVVGNDISVRYEDINNQSYGWGIKKIKGEEPEVTNKQKEDLLKYNAVYMDNNKPKKLYLTFDEGYENGFTAQILDVLKEKNVRAAFFITGPYAKKEQELVKRMIDEGHTVGNHTVNHPDMPDLVTAEKMREEIDELNRFVRETYSYNMKYFRPPQGEYSERTLSVVNSMGMRSVFWSFAYPDWNVNNQKGKDYAISQIEPYLHDGAILLLHAVSSDNTSALQDVIDYARSVGYEFACLDEIS